MRQPALGLSAQRRDSIRVPRRRAGNAGRGSAGVSASGRPCAPGAQPWGRARAPVHNRRAAGSPLAPRLVASRWRLPALGGQPLSVLGSPAAATPDLLLLPASRDRKEKCNLALGPALTCPGVRASSCLTRLRRGRQTALVAGYPTAPRSLRAGSFWPVKRRLACLSATDCAVPDAVCAPAMGSVWRRAK